MQRLPHHVCCMCDCKASTAQPLGGGSADRNICKGTEEKEKERTIRQLRLGRSTSEAELAAASRGAGITHGTSTPVCFQRERQHRRCFLLQPRGRHASHAPLGRQPRHLGRFMGRHTHSRPVYTEASPGEAAAKAPGLGTDLALT
ncbi:hypothetical protein E2C01_037676 [Portunus trituberculatus]|uniref:Uncharacterized protein n=1 Tax=Portunus trituberculatus TaxID=210409 RepID=A0A5B7FER1_PORTR|nr:hypothetical protein [Portunus trituberculatus]